MPDSFDYTTGTNSENVRLLQALIDEAPEYTEETNSRNANILKSIINNTEYTDAPQSEIEELLLRLKAKIGGEIEVDELTVTENGTYDAGVNKAYNPVNVELPLSSKTITENGTYTASDDNLAGYSSVTVAVEGYAKKSIENTPTAIATFNASSLPMPSLNVSIEAVQSGTGDPSPTNVRPISGCSAVNRYRTGKNLFDVASIIVVDKYINISNKIYENADSRCFIFPCKPNTTYTIKPNNSDVNIFRIGLINVDYTNIPDGTAISNVIRKTDNSASTITTASDTTAIVIQENKTIIDLGTTETQIELGETATTYEAFSGTTYTTQLKDGQCNPLTCYGGELSNVNGVQTLTLTHGYIASYNGETLPSTWISDRDVYAEGTTPTTGAEVVYTLATPQTISQDNLSIASSEGVNNIWADSGNVLSGEYMEAL